MFNSDLRKEALDDLSRANDNYTNTVNTTTEDAEKLYKKRQKAVSVLKNVEKYINSLKNVPYEYSKIIGEIRVRRQNFESTIQKLEIESAKIDQNTGTAAGAGIAAGVGVGAFGPTAAMGIATTFGTASTGAAISTLSGAAATNAALAWLGGGALAAGGGGMAAGNALLALAGPIGWAIGGTALVGSGIIASVKNKKIAEEAESNTRIIKSETEHLEEVDYKVVKLCNETTRLNTGVNKLLSMLESNGCCDFHDFSQSDRNNMASMLNSAETISVKIGITVE